MEVKNNEHMQINIQYIHGLGTLLLGCCLCRSKLLSYGMQKSWWGETPEAAPHTSFSLLRFGDGRASAGGRDGPPKRTIVQGLTDLKHDGALCRLEAVRGRMVAGIGAGDHRNGGARRLMAAVHYREEGGEEEGPFRPWTHPGACGQVGEGAGCRTAAT